jgi:uncharacterized membrane protein
MFGTDFDFSAFAQGAGEFLDAAGVLFILGGVLVSTAVVLVMMFRYKSVHATYSSFRYNLARSIIIGLEFLIAGDIVRTVAGDLSLRSVLILGLIILIRTFLGVQFEVEIEGRWPWQRGKSKLVE